MALNVLGTELKICGLDPITGFYRNGCCDTGSEDLGMHTVCIQATEEFLKFSKAAGNDLSTPLPEYDFKGLKPNDRWCLCMERWIEALDNGMAPKVFLEGTHVMVLEHIDMHVLKKYAISF